jgi:hypothetical protein
MHTDLKPAPSGPRSPIEKRLTVAMLLDNEFVLDRGVKREDKHLSDGG